MNVRMESDTMGQVAVPADRLWGAQTQRSLQNFAIGAERMPEELIRALVLVKKSCAAVSVGLGRLSEGRHRAIATACDLLLDGGYEAEFPLSVWQTGSGTQTNMNVNEVIARLGSQSLSEETLHPNDHVNLSQSSNDVFPTAMHVAAAVAMTEQLFPALLDMTETLEGLEARYGAIVKTGRTHLQDAVPIRFGQEISAFTAMLREAEGMLRSSLPPLYRLAIGGTAVGTGLNAPAGFGAAVCTELAAATGLPFVSAENKFHTMSAKDAVVFSHAALKTLAANLMKMANDIRWLASGPRCGLGEIFIPENEPGSSIMPGKVNPTQCEALTMVAVQVMANDVAISMGASQGNFQLNVFMPLCAYNHLQSIRLLSDAMRSFTTHCLAGLRPNEEKMAENLDRSLMTVTALTPLVGYEAGAAIAKQAYAENSSLREAAVALGYFTEESFDAAFHPEEMA